MSNEFKVVPLTRQPRDVVRFLSVAYQVYGDDPCWVAPLMFDIKKVFSDANPLFMHAEMQLWVASRNGRDIGRIAAVVDQHYNRVQNDKVAFFGFFECANDLALSAVLFDAACGWARERRMTRILGPMNPTSNDECGLLVDGFDTPPVFMMTYNPPYYVDLVVANGFAKAKDLIAYIIDLSKSPLDRLDNIASKARTRNPDLVFRPVTKRSLVRDLAHIKEVYNEAWESNWGFVPMTDPEVDFMAERLKPLLVEGLVWLVESPTGPVAFLLAVPDFNQALRPLRGRLFTPRVVKLVPYAFGWVVPKLARVVTLGVKDGYRNRGLESVMLIEGLKVGFRLGFTAAEASWVLEDNVKMRRMIEVFGARPYKTYRIYQRVLEAGGR